MDSSNLDFVPTKFSQLSRNPNLFEAVVYESYSKKQKMNENVRLDKDNHREKDNIMDMKKVRYDVFKFAMSGFNSEEKEMAKINLAIQLGAKPPKNKYFNYKEFKELKKKNAKEKAEKDISVLSRPVVRLATRRKHFDRTKQKPEHNILQSYGNLGKVKSNKKKKHK